MLLTRSKSYLTSKSILTEIDNDFMGFLCRILCDLVGPCMIPLFKVFQCAVESFHACLRSHTHLRGSSTILYDSLGSCRVAYNLPNNSIGSYPELIMIPYPGLTGRC